MVSAVTLVPGWTSFFSTRPGATAEIQRICSGTRVPGARTSRSMGPDSTVSMESAARSTLGGASLRRLMPAVMRTTRTSAPAAMYWGRRLTFFSRTTSTGASLR
jgi:hypothetical protein